MKPGVHALVFETGKKYTCRPPRPLGDKRFSMRTWCRLVRSGIIIEGGAWILMSQMDLIH